MRSLPRTSSARVVIGAFHAAQLLASHISMSRGCAPGGSITADWWYQVSEMSEEEVKRNLQVVSITVNFGVENVRQIRPDWPVEKCEHFIDTVYRDLVAETQEAGADFMRRVIERIEEDERGEKN